MKREPILFIRGNKERAEEIKTILEKEWCGDNSRKMKFDDDEFVFYINEFGFIVPLIIGETLSKALKEGWMQEYILLEKPRFKPFDKVVVKIANSKWYADLYSHEDERGFHFIGDLFCNKEDTMILPFNEETAKLIGTNDEWKGGDE